MRLLALRNVLVATDLDSSSDGVIDSARRLADAAGATLHVVHVLSTSDQAAGDRKNLSRDQALERATTLLAGAGVRGDGSHLHVVPGEPAATIRALADRLAADVIVLGAPRNRPWDAGGVSSASTSYAVAARAFAPCLVVARPLKLPLERILVPVDLSETARGALLAGLSWASALRVRGNDRQSTLVAMHACRLARADTESAEDDAALAQELDVLRRHAGEWAGVGVRAVVTPSDNVAETILNGAQTEHPDLVVLGTRGLGLDPVERLGSVSLAVLEKLQVPALLVPPAVWRAYAAEQQPRVSGETRVWT